MPGEPQEFSHPYYDIEIEPLPATPGDRLIKILAMDGRRFTYLLKGTLDAEAVTFVKKVIDIGMISDLVIERIDGQFQADEATEPLKKHG